MQVDLVPAFQQRMVFEQNLIHLETEIVALVVWVLVAFREVIMEVVLAVVVEVVVLVLSWHLDYHKVIVVDNMVMFPPWVKHDDKVCSDQMMNSIFV